MSFPLWVIDAFTAKPFHGNPAAVCLLPSAADPIWMQSVAGEMNLSETAFVSPRGERIRGETGWDLRWFTPTTEVALCGHATLASAHALWETGRLASTEAARFETQSGWLICVRRPNGIAMDFPARRALIAEAPAALLAGLGCPALWVGRDADDYLVEVADAVTVRTLGPDLAALRQVASRGVIVTARSDLSEYDFVSRFFAPAVGVDEDPVTGSAHCSLAVYWANKLGKTSLIGWQASRRGGAVEMTVRGDRVTLHGPAVTVWRGELI